MNWIDPWGLMQKAAFERDHCGSGGGACVAFGILALVDYLGDGIKKAGESIADGVKQGAHWAGKKISEGVSAAKVYFSKGKNKKREVPAEDRDAIAKHSHERGHGEENDLNLPTEEAIRNKIDEVLDDPDTQVGTRKRDGAKGYLGPDGTLVIHNPTADGKGTIFYPTKESPQDYFNRNFKCGR